MKNSLTFIFLFFGFLTVNSQTATEIVALQTPDLDETSGLLFYNNTVITFNDSGGEANLYEVNTSTGNISRTVAITNATNVDWEDITQDASYIYIGDIGNNNGSRTDLKIYKISKVDYDGADDTAVAEVIAYSYADQTDFTPSPNNTNWDAEGLISYGEKLLIFSKNWVNNMVNVYSIPKITGTHSALLESSYNTNGLITGAEISPNEDVIYLTGYSSSQAPFIYTIHGIPINSFDIFSGIISEKITNIVPLGNQVEAIALFEITPTTHRLYISNEKFVISVGPLIFTFPAKLWLIEIDAETVTLEPDTTWDGSSWNPSTPDNTMTALIAGDYDTCIVGADIDALKLTVASGSTLTLCAGKYLKVEDDIIIDGTLIVEHEGSLVQVNDGASLINNGTVMVKKTTPLMAAKSFMIIGSPMTGETREGVYGNSYIVRRHVTGNFVPNPDVEVISPGINNWADDNGNNWLTHSGELNAGEGYLVFPQPDGTSSGSYTQTYTQGTLTNGVINFPLIFNEPGPTAVDNQNASPNVLANPYASAIDAELFFDDPANANINVLYFWEHNTPLTTYPGYNALNFSMADISLYSESLGGLAAASGGATPTRWISSGQGFAVKPSAGGTAQFNNAMRVTSPNNTYRDSNFGNSDRIWINVFNDTYQLGSTALIGFSETFSDAFVNSEDIVRLATPVSIYSELENGKQLAINALDTFDTEDTFYLSFSTQVTEITNYRLSIQNMEGLNIENASVVLIDNLTGSVINLIDEDYNFQSGEAMDVKRFKIVFENSVLGNIGETLETISIFPNPTTTLITIISPKAHVNSAIVYDVQGRKLSEVNFRNRTNYQIDISEMEAAVYFIDIITEGGTVKKRVLKKE